MSGAIVTHDAISGAVVRAVATIAAGQPIYDERMLQEFQEPCFFVIETSVSQYPHQWPHCVREHRIEVTYFPETEALSHRHKLSEWREILMETLDEIYVDAIVEHGQTVRLPVHARNVECRFTDDHLTWYGSFIVRCRREVSGVPMETLDSIQHIDH